jgi:hypothetical protein
MEFPIRARGKIGIACGKTLVSDVPDGQTLDSRYNDFLFSEVGEQENGMPISMASALTRLGLDPWDEARRLASLPPKSAAVAITTLIERVPGLPILALKIPEISARLVPLLARGGVVRHVQVPTGPLGWWRMFIRADQRWLFVAIAIGALVAVSRVMFSG